MAEGRPLLSHLDPDLEAFSDIEPLYRNFELVDQQYPGGRFVLTVRPVDEWLESRRRHVERNQVRKAAGEYDGVFLEVDLDGWRAEFDGHCAAVRAHFAGRTDYLEIDLTDRPIVDAAVRAGGRTPAGASRTPGRTETSTAPCEGHAPRRAQVHR